MKQKNKAKKLIMASCVGLALGLMACSEAKTLGDKDPDEVKLTANPTWENGAGRLIQSKCATCHTVPSNKLSPDDIPKDLDLRRYDASGDIRGAKSLAFYIKSGILTKTLSEGTSSEIEQMPPEFATPLTDQEIAGLVTWANSGAPEDDSDLNTNASTVSGSTNTSGSTGTTGTGTGTGTATSASATSIARGKVLFETPGKSGANACSSCHSSSPGTGPSFSSITLTGTSLANEIRQMWESSSRANNGSGSFSSLSSADQTALSDYMISKR